MFSKIILPLLCMLLFATCTTKTQYKESYLNPDLPSKERVNLLLREMTLDEKIGQLCQYIGNPSGNITNNVDEQIPYELSIGERADMIKQGLISSFLKVPTYKEANTLQRLAELSRLKIPLIIATDAMHGHGMYEGATTVFPTEIGIAATFDTSCAYSIAKYTAIEMRATGYQWSFSPNIEVVRDCRWGRTGETFGEDPFLVGKMGSAMIHAYQGNDFSNQDNVLSCAKHFAGGGISYNGLNGAPADISERTLYECIFPPFIEAIQSNVYTIMPAHNEINGIPCHAHKNYLTNLIRNTWHFNGFFISDWMDIEKLASVHKVTASEKEAAKLAFEAGVDMHMHGPGFHNHIKEYVEEGLIPIEKIDAAVRRILFAKFQLGLFENRYADSATVAQTLLKQEHRNCALESARKSIVLLENKNNILPLRKDLRSIFITGPLANNQAILGDWTKLQPGKNIITALEGIQTIVSKNTKINFQEMERIDSISEESIGRAKKYAKAADVAILVIGDNSIRFGKNKTTGENLDRATLLPSGDQATLIKEIEETGTPLIVVMVNGGAIAWEWMSENVDGLIEAWEPGMYGGQAIAEVIFGDYNPGGRLPVSFPRSVGHNQSFYNHKPSIYHRGYFFGTEQAPLYEFGYGLSYTEFTYSNLKVPSHITKDKDLPLSFDIENTGKLNGDEVILIYINDVIGSVTTPVKKLVAFKRVHLKSGEKATMEFTIANKEFQLFDIAMNLVIEPGEFELMIGNNALKTSFSITE